MNVIKPVPSHDHRYLPVLMGEGRGVYAALVCPVCGVSISQHEISLNQFSAALLSIKQQSACTAEEAMRIPGGDDGVSTRRRRGSR